jgi:hypothetical protein
MLFPPAFSVLGQAQDGFGPCECADSWGGRA